MMYHVELWGIWLETCILVPIHEKHSQIENSIKQCYI